LGGHYRRWVRLVTARCSVDDVHNTITATNRAQLVFGTVPNADTDGHPIGNLSNHNHFRAIGVEAAKAVFGWLGGLLVSIPSGYGDVRCRQLDGDR
jgi:hypothetical protein